ncbi:MAG TPA: DUF4349 domain-containing protein [Acidimicrobiia bacterium]|nr:DUF4349 domain-containing protein [Acidimicrobiia bacterium]
MKRTIGLMALALLFTACAGAGTSATQTISGDLGAAPSTTVAQTGTTAGAGEETDAGDVGIPPASDRKVIYDGRMQLQAANTRAVFDQITALAQNAGGFVASAVVEETEEADDMPDISVVVRLPADRLTATLSDIRGLADRVVSESLSTQDVTDQFVDIEAQLRNLYALEAELLALLAELRDNEDADPAKLLQVFDQIRQTRGEIEQLEGRRQLLNNLVALATLEIGIAPLPAAAPIVPEPAWEPATVAKDALRDTLTAFQGIADTVIRFGLNVLPVLLVTVGPVALIGWFFYRRWQRRTAASEPPAPAPAS